MRRQIKCINKITLYCVILLSSTGFFSFVLTHFIEDTILVVSDILGNNCINTGNIEEYLIEWCSEGHNTQ